MVVVEDPRRASTDRIRPTHNLVAKVQGIDLAAFASIDKLQAPHGGDEIVLHLSQTLSPTPPLWSPRRSTLSTSKSYTETSSSHKCLSSKNIRNPCFFQPLTQKKKLSFPSNHTKPPKNLIFQHTHSWAWIKKFSFVTKFSLAYINIYNYIYIVFNTDLEVGRCWILTSPENTCHHHHHHDGIREEGRRRNGDGGGQMAMEKM